MHWIPGAWWSLLLSDFHLLLWGLFLKLCRKRKKHCWGPWCLRRLRTRRCCSQGFYLQTSESWEERRIWILPRQVASVAMIWVYGLHWRPFNLAWRTFHEMEVSRTADEGGMKMNIKEDGKTTRNFILTQTVIVALDSKIYIFVLEYRASLVAQLVKNLPAMRETLVWFLGQEDPLEKG